MERDAGETKAREGQDEGSGEPGERLKLPELTQAVLEPEVLEQYFRDLEQCAGILDILPKFGAQVQVGAASGWGLGEARDAVLNGRVRGVQIRYRYDGAEWWDTLLCQPAGVRIVRMRQDEPGRGG